MFGDFNILHQADSLAVAAVVSNLRPEDEVRANARLVASAPDLLEALKEAVSEIENLRVFANNHGGMIDEERFVEGRAAIAKAEGSTP